jgi:hypothetical protein
MNNNQLQPGVYELTRDVTNPSPDAKATEIEGRPEN